MRRARRGRTPLTVAAAAAALLLVALLALPAAAEARHCGQVTAGGKTWSVSQRQMNCRFARYAVVRVAAQRRAPRGWRCRRYLVGREFEPVARLLADRLPPAGNRQAGVGGCARIAARRTPPRGTNPAGAQPVDSSDGAFTESSGGP